MVPPICLSSTTIWWWTNELSIESTGFRPFLEYLTKPVVFQWRRCTRPARMPSSTERQSTASTGYLFQTASSRISNLTLSQITQGPEVDPHSWVLEVVGASPGWRARMPRFTSLWSRTRSNIDNLWHLPTLPKWTVVAALAENRVAFRDDSVKLFFFVPKRANLAAADCEYFEWPAELSPCSCW